MNTRFDLEQDILNTWNIIEDIKLYYNTQDQMQEDDKLNYLLGLITIYQAKFEKTFATFEDLCKSGF